MSIVESLKKRRSYYNINKDLPLSIEDVEKQIKTVTELVPDAFNMKSSRLVILFGEKQEQLWDLIFNSFGGKVSREKIDSFKAGAGTILFFYEDTVVKGLQEKFPLYAENFPIWANHSSGMLQLSLWAALRELGIGASLQHYNPVIDKAVKEAFGIPEEYIMIAQMPFGGIVSEPEAKEKEEISKRVRILK